MPPASWDDTQTQNPHQAVHGCKYPTQAFYPNDPGEGGVFFVVVCSVFASFKEIRVRRISDILNQMHSENFELCGKLAYVFVFDKRT